MENLLRAPFEVGAENQVVDDDINNHISRPDPSCEEELIELANLLKSDDFPFDSESFPKLDCSEWSRDDYVAYGKWLSGVASNDPEKPTRPSRRVLHRAYQLGIGPHWKAIRKEFGYLGKFTEEIGISGVHSVGKFDHWSTKDFVQYGLSLVESNGGRKIGEAELQAAFKNSGGPSHAYICKRFGGLARYQELLGFPNIYDWTEDDFVDWGVRVMEANPGKKLTRIVIDEISQKRLGPATNTIVAHFGKLSNYQERVDIEYATQMETREQARSGKVRQNLALIEQSVIPAKLFRDIEVDANIFLSLTASFNLVNALLPELPNHEKVKIARVQPKSLIGAIRVRTLAITAGQIEVQATQMGIFDDIWPMNEYLGQLKVAA